MNFHLFERLHDLMQIPTYKALSTHPTPELRTARQEVARAQRDIARLDALVLEAEISLRARGVLPPVSRNRP